MVPGAAADPIDRLIVNVGLRGGVGGVSLLPGGGIGAFGDSQVSPVGGRADEGAAIKLAGGNFLGVFGLARAVDRDVDKLDVVVVVAVDDEAGLDVIVICEIAGDREVESGLDNVIAAWS